MKIKNLGDKIHFELNEDPNPLGVHMPEVLQTVIEQDEHLKTIFESLTPIKTSLSKGRPMT